MNVIAYWPFHDGGSAEATGASDRAIATNAAHKPMRLLGRSRAMVSPLGPYPIYILLCRCHRRQASWALNKEGQRLTAPTTGLACGSAWRTLLPARRVRRQYPRTHLPAHPASLSPFVGR